MTLEEDLNEIDPEKEELRKALIRSQAAYAKIKKNRDDFTQAVVNAAHDAMLSMGPVPKVKLLVKDTRKAKEEVALLHSTDWQLGKKHLLTTPKNAND